MDITLGLSVDQIVEKLNDGNGSIIFGVLTGQLEGENVVVEDVHVPNQRKGHFLTYVSPESLADCIESIKAANKDILGFVQYQSGVAAFASKTFEYARNEFSDVIGKQAIGLVINDKGEYQVVGPDKKN